MASPQFRWARADASLALTPTKRCTMPRPGTLLYCDAVCPVTLMFLALAEECCHGVLQL